MLNVLVLYDERATNIVAVLDHLSAFEEHSKHRIFYAPAVRNAPCLVDLRAFDAICLHYSVRLRFEQFISPDWARAVESFKGKKLAFLQDEYEYTDCSRRWLKRLGVSHVFTCVPQPYVEHVYPQAMFPGVKFTSVLTGYAPPWAFHDRRFDDISSRPIVLGYRGRRLPLHYGTLGIEKARIADVALDCQARGIPHDIEADDAKRIHGSAWRGWLRRCRAVLGTESGCNLFDFFGALAKRTELSLAEITRLEEASGIRMNQISPRIFEAVACGTVCVLYPGEYSGLLRAGEHYIELAKDHSNVGEVLRTLSDFDTLERMRRKAYDHLIRGENGYRTLVCLFDEALEHTPITRTHDLLMAIVGSAETGPSQVPWAHGAFRALATSQPLQTFEADRGLRGPVDLQLYAKNTIRKVTHRAWRSVRQGAHKLISTSRAWRQRR